MKIVTANRLIDGEVVWLGVGGIWVDSVHAALVCESDAALDDALKTASDSVDRKEVVETYALDVVRENGGIIPKTTKERIRAAGPTIRMDLGKQAVVHQQVA